MQGFLTGLIGGRLRTVLVVSFSLIAAVTLGAGAAATSRTITDYLAQAAEERVARDMDLALAFYGQRVERIGRVSRRLALGTPMRQAIPAASQGEPLALAALRDAVSSEIGAPLIDGNQLVLVLDQEREIVLGQLISTDSPIVPIPAGASWASLPIVETAMRAGQSIVATEVIPAEFLVPVHLTEQARVDLVDTPKAAPQLFDPREGSAGLAAIGITPVKAVTGEIVGAVVAMHLFNNDFTLVDEVREVAGVDTATIFFGDLRVSTNVLDENGKRAIGTHVSQEVGDQVLFGGLEYRGRAYVVNEWFIARYAPLRDHLGQVVGILYVGAREAAFQTLAHTFVARIIYIALGAVCLAAFLALPVSSAITRPIAELAEANRKLAAGEMLVRVAPITGDGELPTLTRSFNLMAETLETTQEQLVQKEKLASVGQLAAGVAHEVNNPLGTILLLADVLYKECPPDSQQRDDLNMIAEQARRCKGIVFDLLSFARENRVMARQTDLNHLVQSLVAEEKIKKEYENVEIVQQLDPRLPTIEADPDQLRQCLVNLMINAVDAMSPDGGVLTISTHKLDHRRVEMAVSDTGHGISPEAKAQLFTPFFTTKPPGKGTGLGLSIIYGIVKMHHGDIRVESMEGERTTFTILLPVKLPETSRPDIGTEPEQRGAGVGEQAAQAHRPPSATAG